jgi:hypothetical protein
MPLILSSQFRKQFYPHFVIWSSTVETKQRSNSMIKSKSCLANDRLSLLSNASALWNSLTTFSFSRLSQHHPHRLVLSLFPGLKFVIVSIVSSGETQLPPFKIIKGSFGHKLPSFPVSDQLKFQLSCQIMKSNQLDRKVSSHFQKSFPQ